MGALALSKGVKLRTVVSALSTRSTTEGLEESREAGGALVVVRTDTGRTRLVAFTASARMARGRRERSPTDAGTTEGIGGVATVSA